ncbi:MFS transporter [Klebsiella pneumoniae subsp. pneumoniae]|nr:MFS transporter [Klebsiella pneumoniae subsp. pneumoniae]
MARSESLKVSHALGAGEEWSVLDAAALYPVRHADYDTYDQQFAQYFSLQFPTPEEGNPLVRDPSRLFRSSGETLFLCLMPWFVNRTGAKWALIIAGLIMSVRIVGSQPCPSARCGLVRVKMMHALRSR